MTPIKINFVIESLDFVNEALNDEKFDRNLRASHGLRDIVSLRGDLHWTAQAYFRLKDLGLKNVALSTELYPDCINVVHSSQLKFLSAPRDAFVVCIQADCDRRIWAHYHIVQNSDQLRPGSSCIYLWSQPGLIGRESDPESICKVGYMGQPHNGNLALHPSELASLLEAHGFEFSAPTNDWHDLSQFDAIIAIRSFDNRRHSNKPPSKLINAWLAGVPFIGGSDSAYAQCGQDGIDYLVAKSSDELVRSLLRLKSDPEFARSLVRNGRKAATRFDNEALAAQWQEVLEGPVSDRYRKWQAKRTWERLRFALLYGLDKALQPARHQLSLLRNAIRNAGYR